MSASVGAILGGAGISAGANLIGSAINGIMAGQSFDFQREMWDKNYNAQKEFAQNSMQWRVADARAAGLHPLAALGQMGSSYTPTSVYDNGPDVGSAVANAGTAIGNAMGQIGLLNAEAELEGKRLENASKLMELQTKADQRNMGQLSNALAEIKKADVQLAQDQAPYTQVWNGTQGLSKDMMDSASESLLGIGAIPDVISAVVDRYKPQYKMMYNAIDSRYPELKGMYSVKHSRDWLGNVVYDIAPSAEYSKAPDSVKNKLRSKLEALMNEFVNY